MRQKKIVIAITGASGVIYGLRVLEILGDLVETHLIISETAKKVIGIETDNSISSIESMASFVYNNEDFCASVASGSFRIDGMLVVPCSVKTLSAIANSYCSSLTVRAADVTLKERRRLVLCVREMPFHSGHLELMLKASHAGAVIAPPLPSFYDRPRTLNHLIDQTAGKLIDLLGIDTEVYKRWKGLSGLNVNHSWSQ